MRKSKKILNSKGFTLIELIVILALLALVTAIAVPSLSNLSKRTSEADARERAKDVVSKMRDVERTFNTANRQGKTPMLAGYNLSVPVGIQRFLEGENNNARHYGVEVKVGVGTPNKSALSYISKDLIVVQVVYYDDIQDASGVNTGSLIEKDSVPYFPYNVATISAKAMAITGIYYYMVTDEGVSDPLVCYPTE